MALKTWRFVTWRILWEPIITSVFKINAYPFRFKTYPEKSSKSVALEVESEKSEEIVLGIKKIIILLLHYPNNF
jgi:hypothetical protein